MVDYGKKLSITFLFINYIQYEKTNLTRPVKDLESYPRRPVGDNTNYEDIKTIELPIWTVTIKIPRDLMTSIERGSIEYAGETIDLQDVEEAEQQNLDQASAAPEMEEELI